MSAYVRMGLLGVALAAIGCGPTVDEVCDNLAQCPEPVGPDCKNDGEELEDRASGGCDGEFDDYLDCLDENQCEWRTACASHSDAVEACVGEFPD